MGIAFRPLGLILPLILPLAGFGISASAPTQATTRLVDHTAPPVHPIEAQPVTLPAGKTALLVMEMSDYCKEPDYFCAPIAPGIGRLLDRARAAGTLVLYTIPAPWKGKPHGIVFSGFHRLPSEPVFYLPGFDKMYGGAIQELLKQHGIDTLIFTGGKANMAILYTASTAVTLLNYRIVIPVDGIAATTAYEKEYTLYQFRVFPDRSYERFRYTTLDGISFR